MSLSGKFVATVTSFAFLACGVPLPARAALVGSEAVVQPGASQARARVAAFFAREDVREALVREGVDPARVDARVQALDDREALDLAGRVDSAPAGGDAFGFVLAVFVILLVTDILGLTKVFPFTRPIR